MLLPCSWGRRARRPRRWSHRGRYRSGRSWGWPGRWRARSRRATPAPRSWRPTPAPLAHRPPGRSCSRRPWPPGCASAGPTRRMVGQLLCQKPGSAAPPGKRCMFSGRPPGTAGPPARSGRVGDQLALGDRRLAVPAREQLLVQVRQPQLPAEHLPPAAGAELIQGGQLLVGRARDGRPVQPTDASAGGRREPDPVRVGLHLLVGPAAEHGLRVVLRIPAADRIVVGLVSSSHWLDPAPSPPRRTSTSGRAACGRSRRRESPPPPPPPRGRRGRAAPTCRCPTRSPRRRRTGPAGSRPRSRGPRSGGPRRGRPALHRRVQRGAVGHRQLTSTPSISNRRS